MITFNSVFKIAGISLDFEEAVSHNSKNKKNEITNRETFFYDKNDKYIARLSIIENNDSYSIHLHLGVEKLNKIKSYNLESLKIENYITISKIILKENLLTLINIKFEIIKKDLTIVDSSKSINFLLGLEVKDLFEFVEKTLDKQNLKYTEENFKELKKTLELIYY